MTQVLCNCNPQVQKSELEDLIAEKERMERLRSRELEKRARERDRRDRYEDRGDRRTVDYYGRRYLLPTRLLIRSQTYLMMS